jgi:N-formylglutamate amidohydrolase
MKLPLLLSVPHAGLRIPREVADACLLSDQDIIDDGDVGAAEIYDLQDEVACYVAADIARAVVDPNRAPDDRRADGVIKTHTCWNVPVYRKPLPGALINDLLERYYYPYHARLSELASGALLGVDCHTMAAIAPPIAPDPGAKRPHVCLSNADGTCPESWIQALCGAFEDVWETPVFINTPFKGGYIIRAHAHEIPWVQVEISRAEFASKTEKRARVLKSLQMWCEQMIPPRIDG